VTGAAIFLFGIPSSLSYVLADALGGRNFLTILDSAMSSWILPLGGILMILYARERFPQRLAKEEFCTSPWLKNLFPFWYFAIRYLTPGLILLVVMKRLSELVNLF
jgi:SNF family Na+-dependent transporter